MIELYQGDCLEVMKGIESESIDLVLADPPFGTTKCKWDSVIPLSPMWKQLKRISKPRTAILLFAQTPFDKVLGSSNLEMLRYEWVWEKTNATGFLNAKKMPLKAHENILVFYKKLPIYNPQKTTGHKRKTAGKKPVLSKHYGKPIKKTHYNSTERYPRDILKYSSEKQKNRGLHESRKPVKLLEFFIKTYTNKNMVVLDFCFGSGSTGEACKRQDRSFIGIEKDAKSFKTGTAQIKKAKYQLSF
jgi:site-specific DNA-methyltransferase (adenine-specific)